MYKERVFIMKKKLLCMVIFGVSVGLFGCGNSKEAKEIDSASLEKVKSAVTALKGSEDTYGVANTVQAPDGNISYLEVRTENGDSYTEYPIDSDGNLGTVSTDKDTGYILSDWLSPNGEFYLVDESEENTVFYSLPRTYAERCVSREYLYADVMVDRLISLKDGGEKEVDLGVGTENMHLYEGKLPSEVVKTIIGVGSYGLYDAMKTDYSDNTSIVKLCDFYMQDLEMNLTFSDANVTFGVIDDILRYVSFEVGGLGTRMYVTKTVIPTGFTVREKPDFSGATEYVETLQETADYMNSFDSYDDALRALGSLDIDDAGEGIADIDISSGTGSASSDVMGSSTEGDMLEEDNSSEGTALEEDGSSEESVTEESESEN